MSFEGRPQQNVILYDDAGNEVGVMLDGAIYRIQGENLLVGKAAGAGANKEVSVIDDATVSATKRLQVEADIKPGATIAIGAASLTERRVQFLTDDGLTSGSPDMIVDGSSTPVVFKFLAHASEDTFLTQLKFVYSGSQIDFDGISFGKSTALTNGILIEAVVNGGNVIPIGNVKANEEWMHLNGAVYTEFGGINVLLATSVLFSGREKLAAGTADMVRVTIRDNFTSAIYGANWLQAMFFGFAEG